MKWVGLLILVGISLPLAAQRPVTKVNVSRPTTSVSVSRPTTQVSVSRPTTAVEVSRPTTKAYVSRPSTQVSVSRPVTEVNVSRPATQPAAVPAVSSAGNSQPAASGKKAAAAQSSSQAKTSMSNYKPPQAKDFKAASALGGGSAGLSNKTNQSEKDASAAASQAPVAIDPGSLTAKDVMNASGKAGGESLLNLLKQKASK